MIESKLYYHPLKDGYDVGDIIEVDSSSCVVVAIDAANQVMTIEEFVEGENG